MDINLLRIVVTVLSFAAFMAIVGYAVYPGNRRRFEEAARLPFDDESDPLPNRTLTPTLSQGRGRTGERGRTLDEFSRNGSR